MLARAALSSLAVQMHCRRASALPWRRLAINQDYRFGQIMLEVVTPAHAGVQVSSTQKHWIPAFAGMTVISVAE